MDDTQQMLRAIINNQSAHKLELLKKIKELKVELQKDILESRKSIIENGQRLNKLGKTLAYLEDDVPTNKDFDNLEKRVTRLEKNYASA